MKQLAPCIAHQPKQLRNAAQQLAAPVQLLNPSRQLAQQFRQTVRSVLVIHLIVLSHVSLRVPPGTRVKFVRLLAGKCNADRRGAEHAETFARCSAA